MEKINKTVIILAGGKGKRMSAQVPKQFLILAGKPILMHTIACFYHYNQSINIIVVLPFDEIDAWNRLLSKHRFVIPHQIISGGDERFFSVQSGLELAVNNGLIAIHDGVRPLISAALIEICFATAQSHGSAVPAIIPTESVRIINGESYQPFDRNKIVLIQTPQIFRAGLIKKAYQLKYLPHFTDDATVFEADGNKITIVDGIIENIKITRPADLLFAETIISSRKLQSIRMLD